MFNKKRIIKYKEIVTKLILWAFLISLIVGLVGFIGICVLFIKTMFYISVWLCLLMTGALAALIVWVLSLIIED